MRAVLSSAGFTGLILAGFTLFAVQTADAARFQISDAVEFNKIINTNAVLTTNVTLNSWIEGPVWIPNGGYLVFSDRDNNKLKRLDPPGTLSDFLSPPPQTKFNGNILDMQEQLVSCQCGSNGLKVVLTTNGVSVPLATSYYGLKFYSPNDLAVKSDGSVWFTDPGYDSGLPLPPPVPTGFQPGLYVYRFYETNGNATILQVITNLAKPNGICFSPDETKLYVADNGAYANSGTIKVYNVTSSNTLTGGSTFCTVSSGIADGFRCDVDGRIWSSAGDGVEIFAPDGHLIGKILLTRTANLCFGGPQYKTLYMVGQPYVSSFPVLVAGAVSIKKLTARSDGNQMNVSWFAPSTGFMLQASDSLGDTTAWSDVADLPLVTNGLNQVSLDPTNAAKFLRLRLN
ncbi:MAG: SMP-30/gluconolactonase/LRE family protein [Verrucomicrobiota bacterium]|jgi:gluconolactonase